MQTTTHIHTPCSPRISHASPPTQRFRHLTAASIAAALVVLLMGLGNSAQANFSHRYRRSRQLGECGIFLRVTQPVRLIPASPKEKAKEARTFDALSYGDRIEVGRGGIAEISFETTGKRYRLVVAANASGTAANAAVQITRDGSDLLSNGAHIAVSGLPMHIMTQRAVGPRLAGRFSPDARIGPKPGVAIVREGELDMGQISRIEDTLADPTHDARIRWEAPVGTPPDAVATIAITKNGSPAEPALFHASVTAGLPDVLLPANTLQPGQRYHWTLQPPPAAPGKAATPFAGPLYALTDEDRTALARDLADFDAATPDDDPADASPLVQKALLYRHYSLWTQTADTLAAALARTEDAPLRASAAHLLAHPLSIRPADAAGGTAAEH